MPAAAAHDASDSALGDSPTGPARQARLAYAVAALCIALHLTLLAMLAHRVPLIADEAGYILSGANIVTEGAWETPQERLQGPLPYVASQLFLAGNLPKDPTIEDIQAIRGTTRAGMLVFSILLLLSSWKFAHDLFGRAAGLWALGLLSVSPMMLGYGGLVISDIAFISLAIPTLWCLWRWFDSGQLRWLIAMGAALGACIATKYLALILAIAVTLAIVFTALIDGIGRTEPDEERATTGWGKRGWTALRALLIAGSTALIVLHASYGFLADTYAPDPNAPLQSSMFQALERLPGLGLALRILPEPLVLGADFQAHISRGFSGQFAFRNSGHWSFYLASIVTKATLPLLIAALWGLVELLRTRRRRLGTALLFPTALLLVYLSVFSTLHIGIRYALLAFPVLAIVAGASLRRPTPSRNLGVGVLLAWALGILVTTWPHYFGYFNPLIGGPAGGYRLFHNTNCDWAQNFGDVARKPLAARHPGLEFLTPTSGPRFGKVATYTSDFARVDSDDSTRLYHWVTRFEPVDNWSSAWLVYDISPEDFERAIQDGDQRAGTDLVFAWLAQDDLNAARSAHENLAPEGRDPRITTLLECWRDARSEDAEARGKAQQQLIAILNAMDRADLALSWIGQVDGASQFDLFFAIWRAGSPREAVQWLQKRDVEGSLTAQQAWLLAAGLSEFGEFEPAVDVLHRYPPDPDDPQMLIYQNLRTSIEAKAEAIRALRQQDERQPNETGESR